jgi:hypothetical protein
MVLSLWSLVNPLSVGVIARNDSGRPLAAVWGCLLHCRDVEEAEAMAFLEGVKLANLWSDQEVVVESDCALVVGKLRNNCVDSVINDGE